MRAFAVGLIVLLVAFSGCANKPPADRQGGAVEGLAESDHSSNEAGSPGSTDVSGNASIPEEASPDEEPAGVETPNHAPSANITVGSGFGDIVVDWGQVVKVSISAVDIDDDPVTWQFLLDEISIQGNQSQHEFDYMATKLGVWQATVIVSDGALNSTATLNITVQLPSKPLVSFSYTGRLAHAWGTEQGARTCILAGPARDQSCAVFEAGQDIGGRPALVAETYYAPQLLFFSECGPLADLMGTENLAANTSGVLFVPQGTSCIVLIGMSNVYDAALGGQLTMDIY